MTATGSLGPASADPVRGLTHLAGPPPATDLEKFPARPISGTWFRAHSDRRGPPSGADDHGCWWFAAVGVDPDRSGRFDLPAPRGTCYFGSSQEVALRERLGTVLRSEAGGGEAVIETRLSDPHGPLVVTEVDLSDTPANGGSPTQAANVPVRAASRYVDRSLSSGTGVYATTQAWAVAFRAAGFGGVIYEPRFTQGARARALAPFGPAGRPDPPRSTVTTVSAIEVLVRLKIRVVPVPGRRPALLAPGEPPRPLNT